MLIASLLYLFILIPYNNVLTIKKYCNYLTNFKSQFVGIEDLIDVMEPTKVACVCCVDWCCNQCWTYKYELLFCKPNWVTVALTPIETAYYTFEKAPFYFISNLLLFSDSVYVMSIIIYYVYYIWFMKIFSRFGVLRAWCQQGMAS